ncbi:MAG: type IV secretory system conjugative DNA transfer family protein [Clostridiales bacterium]|nr:type IV secretory system conjugative DNA transfer family protein [Clostridiales bacterium]
MGDEWKQQTLGCLLLSIIPVVLLYFFRLQGSIKDDPEKPGAMYPAVDRELLRQEPRDGDIVIGRYKGQYVCRSILEDAHYLILGGSGSGKSSCIIIPALLCNPDSCSFILDIKGELSAKAVKAGNDKIRIFNPLDRDQWGYDPLYNLREDSTEQTKFETMQDIAFSLISLSPDIKDPFWRNNARNMMIGLMLYHYRQGRHDLIAMVDAVLSKPITDSISDAMENAKPGSIEYKYLVQFSSMTEETISGVFAEVANALTIFATDADIRYALSVNSRKVNPQMLEAGYSIYLVIREEKLSAYYNLLQLIINQTLAELEKRPEDAHPIMFIIDELPRILSAGKLERLLDASRTLRSRRVRLVLVTQSLEALMTAYSENEAIDLLSNCSYKIVLDASSSKTQQMVCDWAGVYKERRQSVSGKQQRTTSYEDKNILRPSDLMTLIRSKELILISPYGYNRIEKCPYYSDRYFKPLADDIRDYNRMVKELDGAAGKMSRAEKKDQ